jgi:hypothetical protein
VIGFVNTGGSGVSVVWLAGALQGWLIRELDGTGRDHKQIEALLRAEGLWPAGQGA